MRNGLGIVGYVDCLVLTFIHFRQRNLIVCEGLVLGGLCRHKQNTGVTSQLTLLILYIGVAKLFLTKIWKCLFSCTLSPTSISFFKLQYIYLSTCLSTCLSVCLSICICIRICIYIYCVCMHTCMHMMQCAIRNLGTLRGNWSSPSTE